MLCDVLHEVVSHRCFKNRPIASENTMHSIMQKQETWLKWVQRGSNYPVPPFLIVRVLAFKLMIDFLSVWATNFSLQIQLLFTPLSPSRINCSLNRIWMYVELSASSHTHIVCARWNALGSDISDVTHYALKKRRPRKPLTDYLCVYFSCSFNISILIKCLSSHSWRRLGCIATSSEESSKRWPRASLQPVNQWRRYPLSE